MKKKDLSWIDREIGSSWPDVTRGETMDRMKVLQSVVKQVLRDDPNCDNEKWIEKIAEDIASKFSKLVGFAQDVEKGNNDSWRECDICGAEVSK